MRYIAIVMAIGLSACANTPNLKPGHVNGMCGPDELRMVRDANGELRLAPPDASPTEIWCGTVVKDDMLKI